MAKWVDQGESDVGNIYLKNQTQNSNLYLGLYTNATEPAETDTLDQITEPVGAGYGNDAVRMGSGGEYAVSAMNANYYNKVLFTIDSTGLLKKYEGTPASDKNSVVEPPMPRDEMPVCLVTVQDNGSAQPGSILPIKEADIEDRRLFLSRPLARKYLTIPIFGTVAIGTAFDGFVWDEDVVITKVSLHAITAPSGGTVSVDLLKNGLPQGRTVSLAPGSLYNTTDIQDLEYAIGDILGIEVTGEDPQEACEGLRVILHYLSY